MNDYVNVLSHNLALMIKVKGKTQKEIADALGVHRTSISYWISGKKVPRADKIDDLCRVLGCRREDLLGEATTEEEYYHGVIERKLLDAVATLNKEGCEKVLAYITDLNDTYKKKGGESEDPPAKNYEFTS